MQCVQLDTDEWWLKADMMMKCEDGVSPMIVPCVVLALLIPFGLPVAMVLMLYREREALQTHESQARVKFAFLVRLHHFLY